jgi:hypothetical protein
LNSSSVRKWNILQIRFMEGGIRAALTDRECHSQAQDNAAYLQIRPSLTHTGRIIFKEAQQRRWQEYGRNDTSLSHRVNIPIENGCKQKDSQEYGGVIHPQNPQITALPFKASVRVR